MQWRDACAVGARLKIIQHALLRCWIFTLSAPAFKSAQISARLKNLQEHTTKPFDGVDLQSPQRFALTGSS
jgi:hypothetical protein